MRRVRSFLPVAPLALGQLAVVLGCGIDREPEATLDQVAPSRAYSDAPIAIALLGGPFRPPLKVDTQSGAAEVGSDPFGVFLDPSPAMVGRRTTFAIDSQWRASQEIDARIPEGLPAGDYTVGMNDPRGQPVRSTAVFTSLGPDIDPPVVTFLRPASGSAVGGGEKVSVSVRISDGPGHIRSARWTARSKSLGAWADDCPIPENLPGEVVCNFSFIAPTTAPNLESITITVDVQDSVQNRSTATIALRVAWSPTLIVVEPNAVSTTGGTKVVVRGAGFIRDLSQIMIDGVAIGGEVSEGVGDGSMPDLPVVDLIAGTTAPHVQGQVMLTVGNGSSTSAPLPFTFVAPPRVREVSPTRGPSSDWTQVTIAGNHFRPETQFFWSQNGVRHAIALGAPPSPPPDAPLVVFVNENRVSVMLPPGSGVISIIAVDPVSGEWPLANAFVYDDTSVP